VTTDLVGVSLERDAGANCYQRLAPLFSACDLVLVEGHVDVPGVKIEVWREATGGPCLALERSDVDSGRARARRAAAGRA